MRLLILVFKWGFPLLLITDMSSELLENEFLLNISRSLRMFCLVLLIIENVRHIRLIRKFYFFWYFLLFDLLLFIYVFTDEVFFDGLWMFTKTLFWTLGLNVLYAYSRKNKFTASDFLEVIKKVIFIAFLFTALFYVNGDLENEYNIASYLVLFMYPLLLLSTDGYKNNLIFVILSALAILVTLKRGAILAFGVSNVIYYLGSVYSEFSLRKSLVGVALLCFMTALPVYMVIGQKSGQSKKRFSRAQFDLDNDNAGSGRVGMYTGLYEGWISSENIFIGRGNRQDFLRFKSSKGTYAHSDIFGFLYNFGLLGISIIILLYFRIISFYYRLKKFKNQNTVIILSLLAILFLVNLYSGMLLGSTNPIYFFSILVYLQVAYEKNKSANINKPA